MKFGSVEEVTNGRYFLNAADVREAFAQAVVNNQTSLALEMLAFVIDDIVAAIDMLSDKEEVVIEPKHEEDPVTGQVVARKASARKVRKTEDEQPKSTPAATATED